jgi:hypothetical protein
VLGQRCVAAIATGGGSFRAVKGTLAGLGGTLFSMRYLSNALWRDADPLDPRHVSSQSLKLRKWWTRFSISCGPATAIRALFDIGAMPLFEGLGFQAALAEFDRSSARVHLTTNEGTAVGLIVLPWARQPSSLWRDAVACARRLNTGWCFVLAGPFLSLICARGDGLRRSLDAAFPEALHPDSAAVVLRLMSAGAFARREAGSGTPLIDAVLSTSVQFQDRVRSDLQEGVLRALPLLRSALGISARSNQRALDESLTLLYRILFLLFAESRDLVPRRHPVYMNAYSLTTLCRESRASAGPLGLWEALAAVSRLSRSGCRLPGLSVCAFNGALFARRAAPSLERKTANRRPTPMTRARDDALAQMLLGLVTRSTPAGYEEICYSDLGVEQLGAVYERVLDLDPRTLKPLARAAGRHSNRRKETGTFYTPQEIADFVVRRTLAPLVAGRSADAILQLRVLDPAMGSGAFLVSACQFLASAYEHALIEEGRCSRDDVTSADRASIRRQVAQQCLSGVDVNPIAVQLARLSLWLSTLAEGRPLGFLDHRLRAGNSLIGAFPADLQRVSDVPSRRVPLPLLDLAGGERPIGDAVRLLARMTNTPDDTVTAVHAKELQWRQLTGARSPIARWRLALSLWCARWFWPSSSSIPRPSAPETRAAIDTLIGSNSSITPSIVLAWLQVARELETQHSFFHWPLEFSDVFFDETGEPREQPGFDAVIGNPPWEMLCEEARTADGRPAAHRQLVRFIRDSGLYPACDRGHVNLYQPFLDRALTLIRPTGRLGLVLPWGLAVDDGAMGLRSRLLESASIDTIVGLDNGRALFPIHRGFRFMVLVAKGEGPTREFRAAFGVDSRETIAELPAFDETPAQNAHYPVRLSASMLSRVGARRLRVPDVRRAADLELLERLCSTFHSLGSDLGWHARFGRELNVTEDHAHFTSSGMPVLEGKHVQPFTTNRHGSSRRLEESVARQLLPNLSFLRPRLAYRDVSAVGNRLSLIAAIMPANVVTTHTLFCLRTALADDQQQFLCGLFNSYVLNAVVRMLMGGHVTTSLVESLPVPDWSGDAGQRHIVKAARVLARRPTSRRMNAYLQAHVAREYGVEPPEFEQIVRAFPLVPSADRSLAVALLRSLTRRRTSGVRTLTRPR